MPETLSEKNRSCRKKSVIKKEPISEKKEIGFSIEYAMKNNLAAVDEVIFIKVILELIYRN